MQMKTEAPNGANTKCLPNEIKKQSRILPALFFIVWLIHSPGSS